MAKDWDCVRGKEGWNGMESNGKERGRGEKKSWSWSWKVREEEEENEDEDGRVKWSEVAKQVERSEAIKRRA